MLVTTVLILGGLLIDDFETNYVDTNISQSSPINQNLTDKLVTQEDVNETIDPLYRNVEDLQSQDGFFDAVGDGTIVIPTLFINFVIAILTFLGFSTQTAVVLLQYLQLPLIVISFIFVGIITWFIFKIIEQWRRYPT